MLSQEEFLALCDNPVCPRPPTILYDYRTVWNQPERVGDPEGVRNAREIRARYPGKFMEKMTSLESDYLKACNTAMELETARLKAAAPASQSAAPSGQIPDEGTARLREIGEQVLRGLGLEEPGD